MPCYDPPREPNPADLYRQRTAKCLIYVLTQLQLPVSEQLKSDAATAYGWTSYTPTLCSILNKLSKDEQDALIYDARSREARELANWWEDHQELDAARAKLTPAERDALGL